MLLHTLAECSPYILEQEGHIQPKTRREISFSSLSFCDSFRPVIVVVFNLDFVLFASLCLVFVFNTHEIVLHFEGKGFSFVFPFPAPYPTSLFSEFTRFLWYLPCGPPEGWQIEDAVRGSAVQVSFFRSGCGEVALPLPGSRSQALFAACGEPIRACVPASSRARSPRIAGP